MDNKALFRLSYGVFMLSTKAGDKINGCITDTCIQVANTPTRVAISLINTNYTCSLLKESGLFCLSVLDEAATFDIISHWGLQSGRNVDKFDGMNLPMDPNGIPYLSSSTCAVISCKVVEQVDLGTHTLFIAEVLDAKVTSDRNPLLYADYQKRIKPDSQTQKTQRKIKGWKCRICGYIYEGPDIPKDFLCPLCGHTREDFEPVYED
ncbi:flavin reductase [Treponema sp.]|uniref:flavin reductase n=1 Tax=Treponema sp. TaxID=166 RepID=UPI00388CFFE2